MFARHLVPRSRAQPISAATEVAHHPRRSAAWRALWAPLATPAAPIGAPRPPLPCRPAPRIARRGAERCPATPPRRSVSASLRGTAAPAEGAARRGPGCELQRPTSFCSLTTPISAFARQGRSPCPMAQTEAKGRTEREEREAKVEEEQEERVAGLASTTALGTATSVVSRLTLAGDSDVGAATLSSGPTVPPQAQQQTRRSNALTSHQRSLNGNSGSYGKNNGASARRTRKRRSNCARRWRGCERRQQGSVRIGHLATTSTTGRRRGGRGHGYIYELIRLLDRRGAPEAA